MTKHDERRDEQDPRGLLEELDGEEIRRIGEHAGPEDSLAGDAPP